MAQTNTGAQGLGREMSDENDQPQDGHEGKVDAAAPSIFDLFEPPPDIDRARFGPIPVVNDDTPTDSASPDAEALSNTGEFDNTSAVADASPIVDAVVDAHSQESEGLQDWTAPATGQVPAVLASEKGDDAWSDLDGPRWHGEDPEWGAEDLSEVFSDLDGVADSRSLTFDDDPEIPEVPLAAGAPQRDDREMQRPRRVSQRPTAATTTDLPAGRNVPLAIGVGVGLAAIALLAIRWESHYGLLAIVTIAAAVGASELFFQLRNAGLHPSTLLGITAAASMPLSVYHRGAQAFPMVIALTVIFGAIWFIVGAESHKPTLNMSLTLFGVGWIGVLGSFAVLLFNAPGIDGHGLLLAAIVVAVASDTGGYAVGSAIGTRPFHPASKGKTWEGTIGGVVVAVAAALVLWLLNQTPFQDNVWHAIAVGLVGGVLGPIGDLTESIIKRDLGIKDMGTLIPGHGGVLDRIDGILFVLPGVYYLAVMLDYI